MSNPAESKIDATPDSKVPEVADALRKRLDLALVTGGSGLSRAHDKSATEDPTGGPNLSGAAREEALRLAARLANSHSG